MINRELLKADSKGLLKLPTDKVLVEDPEFRKYVILYAKVQQFRLQKVLHFYIKIDSHTLVQKKKNDSHSHHSRLLIIHNSQMRQDEEAFFKDYAASHKRLSELGFIPPSSLRSALRKTVMSVVVATTVVILSYLYEINRREP